jgi:AraC-like DNA-binding protein
MTRIYKGIAIGSHVGGACRPAAVLPDGPGGFRSEKFHTTDPEAALRFFAGAHLPGWRLTGLARLTNGFVLTHARSQAGSITIDDVVVQASAGWEIRPADWVVVVQPRGGSLNVAGNPAPQVDDPLLITHNMPCTLQVNSARFDVVSIPTTLLRRVANDRSAALPQQIRFLNRRPSSSAASRAWQRTLDYVTATFVSPDAAQQPMIVAATASLLACALLECYPSNLTIERDLLNDPHVPAALKDAVSYIHGNADGDVGVTDVAAAVHLTPRAVQYLFRDYLDTTPTEYVRRVRLHGAHQDLLTGNPSMTTVTEIAQRWGFAHAGRFAVIYREIFGQSPHTTLKQ